MRRSSIQPQWDHTIWPGNTKTELRGGILGNKGSKKVPLSLAACKKWPGIPGHFLQLFCLAHTQTEAPEGPEYWKMRGSSIQPQANHKNWLGNAKTGAPECSEYWEMRGSSIQPQANCKNWPGNAKTGCSGRPRIPENEGIQHSTTGELQKLARERQKRRLRNAQNTGK